jgi:hypothetical protein
LEDIWIKRSILIADAKDKGFCLWIELFAGDSLLLIDLRVGHFNKFYPAQRDGQQINKPTSAVSA